MQFYDNASLVFCSIANFLLLTTAYKCWFYVNRHDIHVFYKVAVIYSTVYSRVYSPRPALPLDITTLPSQLCIIAKT